MRQFLFFVVFMLCNLALMIQSCTPNPYACISTDVNEDSIRVNQPVTFSSFCSINGEEYFWEFFDNADSVEFSRTVTKTFYDTGSVKVFLLVTNRRKTSSVTKYYEVKP